MLLTLPMDLRILSHWHVLGDLLSKRTAQESAALIILAASFVVFRSFRQRYLLVWIVGWFAYLTSCWTLHGATRALPAGYLLAIVHAEFVLALCLFGTAVLIYTHARKFVPVLAGVSLAVMAYAIVQALLWPNSHPARLGLEISYRVITFVVAFHLLRVRWARAEAGAWLLFAGLLLLHLDWAPLNLYLSSGTTVLTDLLLGISMMFVVFDDSRLHTRRLAVINALANSISRAQQRGPVMTTALEEFKGLLRAKAAWYRLTEGDALVLAQEIGLSENFVRDRNSIALDDTLASVMRNSVPAVIKVASTSDSVRPYLRAEKFQHVVVVPMMGKKAPVGVLFLGSRRRVSYAPDELDFLAHTAHQLGLAVENLRLVEQVLRSHRQWSNTFDSIHDSVLVHDEEFRIMKANRALLGKLDQSPADVMDKTCEEAFPQSEEWKGCPYCREGEEGVHEGADPCFGDLVIVSTSSYVEQGSKQKATIHVVRDVTDRHVAEERYRQLFEQVQEGIFLARPDGAFLECNDAFVHMLGYGHRDEVMGLNIETDVYAVPEQRETLRREITENNYVRNFEIALRKKDGTLLTALVSSFATRDLEGKVERYQGFLLDITEKKLAEDEIRRRNRELNALNAMAVIATQSFDLDEILNLTLRQVVSLLNAETGSIYLCDPGLSMFRRRAGWGQRSGDRARLAEVDFSEGFGDLVTRSRTEVITPEYLPHLPPLVAEFVRADGLSSWIWVLLWSKDSPVGIMGISSPGAREYTSNDESLLVAIGRQLATTIEKVRLYEESCRAYEDLRCTQEQLLHSEKMSAIGQLISGVAHELNNPLTAILGYAQLLESEGLSERAADFVGKLFKQAQRTHRVVQNLLSFARQSKPQKARLDICQVLDETLTLRDYDLKVNNIELVREIEASLPAVTGDANQLEQVFLNVINNAVDAMLESGKGGQLLLRVRKVDEQVHVEFHDSGPGIKEPGRIFDPFYTTKNIGKGTGLGLSICYGIVKEHGGEITARNREEGGATIEIALPAAAADASDGDGAVGTPDPNIGERVLLVEDESAVLEFERDVLTGSGLRVIAMLDGDEVKSRLERETFDAVIIGGKMASGWQAPDIYRWLEEKRPGMEKRVLFTFSTEAGPELRSFLDERKVPYLVKPFEITELISLSRRLSPKSQAAMAN